jgi:murein L,D-transpeptidase YafK
MAGARVIIVSENSASWIAYALVTLALLIAPVATVHASDFPIADKVVVDKGNRVLHLMDKGVAFRTFKIALGLVPDGDKQQEGDQKTPEGNYMLDGRNPNSDFFLSIHVSYPNSSDRSTARTEGVNPGGQIMIHGQPNSPTYSEAYYAREDWTNGCIAVSDSDMIDIWLMTPNNVPIEIIR